MNPRLVEAAAKALAGDDIFFPDEDAERILSKALATLDDDELIDNKGRIVKAQYDGIGDCLRRYDSDHDHEHPGLDDDDKCDWPKVYRLTPKEEANAE